MTVPKFDAAKGHGELLFPRPGGTRRTEALLHKHELLTLANVTPSYGYRGRVSMMHSWSSDIVVVIYMHAGVRQGSLGEQQVFWGKPLPLALTL